MSKQKHKVLHFQYRIANAISVNGEQVRCFTMSDKGMEAKMNDYLQSLEPDQIVDVFMDANKDDGTLAQLAKIHACIKQLAIDTGDGFEDVKFEVKRLSGLCIKKEIHGETYMICKSMSKCSKEELALVIDVIIKIGQTVGINFH